MTHPLGSPAALVLVLLLPASLAAAQGTPQKAPDVMTVNGVQVAAPASVPDLVRAVRAGARRVAPLAPGAPAAPFVAPAPEARRAPVAPVAPNAARVAPPAASLPALLGPLPRSSWGAAAVPVAPKPAEVVTIGEPTGVETPPAVDAPAAPRAKPAAKPAPDRSTSAPREASAAPPSAAKPEVKR